MGNEADEDLRSILSFGTKSIFLWGFAFAIVCGVVYVVSNAVEPRVQDLRTAGTEHSYTYVQTKRELMVKLVQDYRKLEVQQSLHADEPEVWQALEAQKKAIVDRLRIEASSLPEREIPNEARPFLQ